MGPRITEMDIWIALVSGFVLSIISIQILIRFSPSLGLLDKSDGKRKNHDGDIPVVGGVAMYISVLITSVVVGVSLELLPALLIGGVLVIVGLVDDFLSLGTRVRILLQILCASAMLFFGDSIILSVGNLFGQGPVAFTILWMGGAFTVLCTVGVINSINMIDGMDGLSGALNVISFSALAYYCHIAGDKDSLYFILACITALLGFLYFNSRIFRKRAAVFMGDAGSTFFGFILVWFYIQLTQGNDAVLSPVSAGWIFGLPLADTISVMVGRIRRGQSPFAAGRDHLHHQLLDYGFSVNNTLLIMAILQVGFVAVGVANNSASTFEAILFWIFVLVVVSHHFLTPRILVLCSPPNSEIN